MRSPLPGRPWRSEAHILRESTAAEGEPSGRPALRLQPRSLQAVFRLTLKSSPSSPASRRNALCVSSALLRSSESSSLAGRSFRKVGRKKEIEAPRLASGRGGSRGGESLGGWEEAGGV